jgi:hypothetical protein
MCCLTFPNFILKIDNAKDCILWYALIGHKEPIPTLAYDYDEQPAPKTELLDIYQGKHTANRVDARKCHEATEEADSYLAIHLQQRSTN